MARKISNLISIMFALPVKFVWIIKCTEKDNVSAKNNHKFQIIKIPNQTAFETTFACNFSETQNKFLSRNRRGFF